MSIHGHSLIPSRDGICECTYICILVVPIVAPYYDICMYANANEMFVMDKG